MYRRKINLILCCSILIISYCSNIVYADSVKINVSEDNWISSCSSSTTVNYGNSLDLRVRTSW